MSLKINIQIQQIIMIFLRYFAKGLRNYTKNINCFPQRKCITMHIEEIEQLNWTPYTSEWTILTCIQDMI